MRSADLIDLAVALDRGDVTRPETIIARLKRVEMDWLARSYACGMSIPRVSKALKKHAAKIAAQQPS